MRVYQTRWEFIEPYVKGKTVLDVGATELVGTINSGKMGRWLHKKIADVAYKVVGLEQNNEQVQILRKIGYDIRCGDAETFNCDEHFDVIVAGELIEHLSNPGKFIECSRSHLRSGGTLVLTTPNRFDFVPFFKAFLMNRITAYNKPIAKHVVYFDEESVKSLLERYGFSDITIAYYESVGNLPEGFKTRLVNVLLRRYRPIILPGLLAAARIYTSVS